MATKPEDQPDRPATWRICLECGNRYQVRRTNSSAKWCSVRCQAASYRTGRERAQEAWPVRLGWWLR